MQQLPRQPTERPRLLLVDDDAGARRALQLLLSGRGIEVRAYGAAADLLADPTALDASILVADYRMPGADGLDVLARLRERRWAGRALLITGYPEPGLRAKAQALGYERVLEKPLADAALLKAVDVLMSGPAK
ncbi:response regulator [Caulobacter zeae]|uniref:Response regulator n=2 Tax=Caulobacter zeae TaxID=2055137 RepID=A0A2N5DRG0_9CAUL|nr:response regulator [Caulobacter zeae]